MPKIYSNIFLNRAKRMVDKINSISFCDCSEGEMKQKTNELKERIKNGEKLTSVLPEAYALVSEAATRVTGMTPFPVQLIGGIALHEGKIAEIKTGEGKTLVATLPSFLNALTGKGVHVVTVNDYLAKRDAESMGKIHEYLGLSVGCVLSNSTVNQKKEAYACDITYVTNTELGFDYLRDNMAQNESYTVLRGLEYAIVDEVDSILIDEARTPLIISGEGTDNGMLYKNCDMLAKKMEKGKKDKEFNKVDAILGNTAEETGDFIVHQKEKNITLTSSGIKKIEEFFRLKEYADVQNIHIQHAMEQALKANYLMERDKDYIVANDQIFLVDTFTGRIMEGRQYSDGLHQAIEAKENVSISLETKILATTSYQNFFNKYKKLSGMTGTAFSEKREFKHTYHLSVVVVPTNRPMIRQDHDDVVYLTKKGKLNGIMEEIKRTYEKGQPILIGTSSVSSSEEISKMLANENIPHQVLNAKQDRNEAEIIAKAGQAGTVTVATNMAGRGTDIVLDQKSLELGGLKVIGTERHEARRIDDQLRGRSGRQGDPGESIFFLSLEDKMVKLFSPERIKNILLKGGFPEDMPLKEKFLTSSIRKAQQKVEKNHYATRKNVLDYDKVNNCQRELIYAERRKLLQGQKIEDAFLLCLDKLVMTVLNKSKINPDSAISFLYESIGSECPDKYPDLSKMKKKEAMDWIHDVVYKEYKNYPCPATYREDFIRAVLLYAIDNAWMKQLQTLECLRQDIFYVGYSQTDPKSVYSIEAFQLFEKMRDSIYYMAVYMFFHTIPEIHVQSQVKE